MISNNSILFGGRINLSNQMNRMNSKRQSLAKLGVALASMTIFGCSLGMVQPQVTVRAAQSQSSVTDAGDQDGQPVTANQLSFGPKADTFKNGATLSDNSALDFDFHFNAPGNSPQRIHAGDLLTINIGTDLMNYQKLVASPLPAGETNPFEIQSQTGTQTVIRVTRDLKDVQQMDLVVYGTLKSGENLNGDKTVTTTYTPVGQNPITLSPVTFTVKNTGGGGNYDSTVFSNKIFGGRGGLQIGTHMNEVAPNHYAYSNNSNGEDKDNPGKLYFIHDEPSMMAFAQLSLPHVENRPTDFSWTIVPTDSNANHKIDVSSAEVWVSPYAPSLTPYKLKGAYTVKASGNGIVFHTDDLRTLTKDIAAPKAGNLNIVFDVNNDLNEGGKDVVPLTSHLDFIPVNNVKASDANATLQFVDPNQAGFTPNFIAQDMTISLDDFSHYFSESGLMPAIVKQDFVKAGSAGNYGDLTGAHYTYTATDVSGQKLDFNNPKAGTYEIQVTAHNKDGNETTRTAKLTITASDHGGGGGNVTPPTPAPTPTNPDTPNSSSSSSSSDQPIGPEPDLPDFAAKKDTAVYALKKIGIYRKANFSNKYRENWYSSKPRVYRPMFVVTGYARSINGHLRYQVRDVNHLSKTHGRVGYITANWKYVRPVYYAKKHSTMTVINPRGVNAYKRVNLTGKVRNYKQGTVLHVTKFVKHNLTTRYVLSNGQYVTGNRKLVEMGKHKQVRYVKAERTINRYQTVNLTHKNKRHIKRGTKIRVKNYDFSHANSVTNHGALRYHVAGGYITGNSKFVKAYK
ncbi:hypothetical protein FD47_GL002813 [Lentilactobacillus parafarraginis DSM 18390 = JCM 14109]|uniref:DUF5776 domain-containing protein n=1 Tax=Lentilactobacillus parafarraginis DSM 18390 = JCM 14109 TaxID=1423786 RepID=A0A0R1YCZ6_9LACO|nr:hypothetical protein FD47_GL002813 [Lentilactobacillus parafarraginis DSM 18390 = JCM 14109]